MTFRKHTKVLTVFSFLRLKSADIIWYQWIYPTVLFVIVFVGFYLVGRAGLSYDTAKLIADINSLMGILVGFYIAALAAVSSFTNENLDQIMKGRAPTLTTVRQGQKIIEKLTRRRFLSVLFGYCATLSIMVYIFGVLSMHVSLEAVSAAWIEDMASLSVLVVAAWWAVYIWMISSLLIVTLLGLHYLVERMHRS